MDANHSSFRLGRPAFVALLLLLSCADASAQDASYERAKKIVAGRCFLCHGFQGEAASEVFPRLASQNAAYIAKQLENFKSGERRSGTMRPMAEDLTAEDMRALGVYFSRQPSEPHASPDGPLFARGKTVYEQGGAAKEVGACAGCHGTRGHGSERLPRLAGQPAAYLQTQLERFGSRERTNDNAVMHTIAARMTAVEIRAVATYLSGLD